MKNKIKIIGTLVILFSFAFISLVIAENYCWLKMSKNEKIHITTNDYFVCEHTSCQVCVDSRGWYSSWNKCYGSSLCNSGGSQQNTPLTLEANFPFQDGGFFTKQSFFMDIITNKISKIDLIDNVNRKQINLCPNCNEYKKSITFKEGFNNITIRAVKGLEIKEKTISFFIDNKKPRIIKTYPLNKKYANGEFNISYDEENIKKIELNYGTEGSILKKELVGCESGIKKQCSVNVDLSPYDGREIVYWFSIKDIVDNEVLSKQTKVYVDKTNPVINNLNFSIDKRYVNLVINITESNLDKVYYYEDGREKILCTRLNKNNQCIKKIVFKSGHHDILVEVMDKAGNKDQKTISFDIA